MATPSPRDDYQATLRAVSRVDVQNLGRAGATCCQILGVLARYTRAGSPLCWLGTEAMALELRRNGSTVKRAMALLDKHGHISRYQVKGLGRMFAVHPSGRWATRPSANAIVDHLASWQNASGFRNRRLPAGGNDLRASVARWAVGLDPAASMAARTGGVMHGNWGRHAPRYRDDENRDFARASDVASTGEQSAKCHPCTNREGARYYGPWQARERVGNRGTRQGCRCWEVGEGGEVETPTHPAL
jgi:hypothetical protein